MKNLFIRLLLAGSIFVPIASSAELLIYKGAETDNYFGANNQERRVWKVITIIDRDNGSFARILYGTFHGTKR